MIHSDSIGYPNYFIILNINWKLIRLWTHVIIFNYMGIWEYMWGILCEWETPTCPKLRLTYRGVWYVKIFVENSSFWNWVAFVVVMMVPPIWSRDWRYYFLRLLKICEGVTESKNWKWAHNWFWVVAELESGIRIIKFKMADPIWRMISKSFRILIPNYHIQCFTIADYDSDNRF